MILSSRRALGAGAALVLAAASAHGQATERLKLFASDPSSYDHFGGSVAISGDVAAVGAPLDDTAAGKDAGSVSVYRYQPGSRTWKFEQQLTALDGAVNDQFGTSVALSGNVLVIGVPLRDAAVGADAGAAYVYRFDGTSWVLEQELASSDAAAGDEFGRSVATTGTVALVGAPEDDAPFINSGSAYVFRYQGPGLPWREEQKLGASDDRTQDSFGFSVSLQDGAAVVGAPAHEVGSVIDAGAAYIYRYASNRWLEEARLVASDPHNFDQLGTSVALSGDVMVAGAIGHDAPSGSDAGAAYVFRLVGGGWGQEQRLEGSASDDADLFGQTVAVRGNLIVVGAPSEDGTGYWRGAVYFYRYAGQACGWVEDILRVASDQANGDFLGVAVAIGEHVALAGAVGDDGAAGFDTGSVSLFDTAELTLAVTPERARAGDPIAFTTSFGEPGQPVMLALVAINGSPLFQPLTLRSFDATYRWRLTAPFPGGLPSGTALGFQSFKMAECGGQAIASDPATVTVE